MKVVWSRRALADREGIFDHVAAVRRLIDFPQSGRYGRVAETRELVVTHTPFIVVYSIDADGVRILRVLHGARKWPPGPKGSR